MEEAKVISFDVEGTLVTPDFSYAVWFEAIPNLYAKRRGVGYKTAKRIVEEEYGKVGDQMLEWYDIGYWFNHFGLGTPMATLKGCRSKVRHYPEVLHVLEALQQKYKLVVASGSAREFLQHLLKDIEPYFDRVFSSISDYKQLKTKAFYSGICQELRVSPNQIIHVGDNRQFDYDNPQQVGIKAFHLDRNGKDNCRESVTDLRQLQSRLLS